MLAELEILLKKANGTKYHSLFSEIYLLTKQIEAAYRKRYPDNENKILYFHERYTRAFVDAYSLLMQNLLLDESTDGKKHTNDMFLYDRSYYAEAIAEKIKSSIDHSVTKVHRPVNNIHEDWNKIKSQLKTKQLEKHKEVWDAVNNRKAMRRRSKSLANACYVNVDTSYNLTWFKFPGEKEVYKLMHSAKNPIFINEINNRYYRNSGGFCDKVVNYLIEESGKVILELENKSYFILEREGKPYNPHALVLTPVYFTIKDVGGVYEREQLTRYIKQTMHRITDGSIVSEPDFKKLMWKAYVYDNMRWALCTKQHEDLDSIEWTLSYGDSNLWSKQKQLFESLVDLISPANEIAGEANKIVLDKIKAYDRAIDYLHSKRILNYSDNNHHIL